MASSTFTAAQISVLKRALDGVLSEAHAKSFLDYVFGELGLAVVMLATAAEATAIDTDDLKDGSLIFVNELNALYAYRATSTATATSDNSSAVIEPASGVGRLHIVANGGVNLVSFLESQTTDPSAGDNLPSGADGTYANSNRLTRAMPCKGTLEVWYVGQANPAGIDNSNTAVFKLIKSDNTAAITKTYNTATQPPAAYTPALVGSVSVAQGGMFGWEVITGASADLPKFGLEFRLYPTI